MKLAQILKEMLNEIGETTYQISGPKIVSSNPNSNVVKYFFTALPKKEPKDANEPEDEQPEDSKEEPKGTKYEVVFESEFLSGSDEHKWETEISFDKIGEEEEEEEEEEPYAFFGSDEKYSETGEGLAIPVLFTVAKAVRDFIEKFKPEFLKYSGSLSGKEASSLSDPDKDKTVTTVRDRIYDKMVNDMIEDFPDYGFKREGYTMDIFYKGELPVPGAHKIFKYPKSKK